MSHTNYEGLIMARFNGYPSFIPYSVVFTDSNVSPEVREACGLIPEFFARSVAEGADTLDKVCASMTYYYGFGNSWDFGRLDDRWILGGSITSEGVYQSPYDDDPDLEPLGIGRPTPAGCLICFYILTAYARFAIHAPVKLRSPAWTKTNNRASREAQHRAGLIAGFFMPGQLTMGPGDQTTGC